MRGHDPTRSWWRAARLGGSISAAVVLAVGLGAPAQTAYETPPVQLTASSLLPAELVAGANHRVDEAVLNDGYLNRYRIGSRFGEFTAVSTPTLRIRITEIEALAAMEKVEASSEFGTAFQASLQRTAQGVQNLVTQPVETLSGAASGVSRLFERASESLSGKDARSQAEGSRWQDAVGYAKAKREVAHHFGVDVYTSNAVVQAHLDRIAQANYAGGLSMGAVTAMVPGGAGAFLSVTGTSRLLNDLIATTAPADLRKLNRQKLDAMGVDPAVADVFIANGAFSPRQQTILVAALEELQGTADRGAFVRFASPTDREDVALFRQRMAEMYAGLHRNVGSIAGFLTAGDFVAAQTSGRALVFAAPLDHLLWTGPAARVVDALGRRAGELGLAEKHLWLTGTTSARAREQLRQRGWVVHEQSETRLWARP